MRKPMIAGNWKMNETYSSAVVLAQGLARELEGGTGDVDVVVCPPAVDLKGVAEVIEHEQAPFALGGQNVYCTRHADVRRRDVLHYRPL